MVTKTLTITQDAYNALKEQKKEGESFSQTVLRVAKRTGFPKELIGCLKHETNLKKNMKKNREWMEKGWK